LQWRATGDEFIRRMRSLGHFHIGKTEIDLPQLAVTLAIGGAGGFVATRLHLPLGMLLGSLLAVGLCAMLNLRPLGRTMLVPLPMRFAFVPIIGVSIGGAFTPQVVSQMPEWWVTVLGLFLYIPVAHFAGFAIYRKLGGLDPATAWFGAVPGGLVECVTLGEEAGADGQMLTMLQFLRLILCIIFVPLGFTWLTGHSVGSASGIKMAGANIPIGLWDAAVLIFCAVAGLIVARRLRFPAPVITGPILFSAIAHLAGLTQTAPPGWTITMTQWVVGASLGSRFAGLPKGAFVAALRLALLNVSMALALAFGFGLVLAGPVNEPVAAVFLAYAPGGLAEMGLIALSLQMSVIYVTAHHVVRIVLSVSVAKGLARRMIG
jgi:uncharacterized protein